MDVMTYDEYKDLFYWIIDCYATGYHDDFKYSFSITLKENGRHIGWCGIGGSNYDHNIKEIYYLIERKNWGKGYAKESSTALLDYSFRVMGLKEVAGLCRPENIASQKVIENMGMKVRYKIEGLPEEHDFYNGEYFRSITREEYFALKATN